MTRSQTLVNIIYNFPDISKQIRMIATLKNNLGNVTHGAPGDYNTFLNFAMPAFMTILKDSTKPQFSTCLEHKLRFSILDIIAKLPPSQHLKNNAKQLFKEIISLIELENEENALVCLRILLNLCKSYRISDEQDVQPLMDLVLRMFEQLHVTTKEGFYPSVGPIPEEIEQSTEFLFSQLYSHITNTRKWLTRPPSKALNR